MTNIKATTTNVVTMAHNLISELQCLIDDVDAFEADKKTVINAKKAISDQQDDMERRRHLLDEANKVAAKQLADNTVKEASIKKLNEQLTDSIARNETSKRELAEQTEKLADVKKIVDALDLREKKLTDLEKKVQDEFSLIEHEKIVDKERKESLDLKEAGLKREQGRLQSIAESYKVV